MKRNPSAQGPGRRFGRWVEILAAIVLSLATVATAWCGYQATRWSGEQARAYSEASANRVRASQRANEAMLITNLHVVLFTDYMAARLGTNPALADALSQRFPQPLKAAADAWLALDPLSNPDAPPTPFAMPQYRLTERDEAQAFDQLADDRFNEANQANDLSDEYVRLTVIFATVLLFGGISGKFQWWAIDAIMLVLGAVVFVAALVTLIGVPVR